MDLKKSYIVDEKGKPNAVIVDYEDFIKIEKLLLDYGLAKAMEEIENEGEVDLEEAKKIIDNLKK